MHRRPNPRSSVVPILEVPVSGDGEENPIPPPLAVPPEPSRPAKGRILQVYRPHVNLLAYSRHPAGIFTNPFAQGLLFGMLLLTLLEFIFTGNLSSRIHWISIALLLILAGVYSFVIRPKILKNLTVTLTDTHLRIETGINRRHPLDIRRSGITKVELTQGPLLRRYGLWTVRVKARRFHNASWVWPLGGRVDLIGLEQPGHLRKQLRGLDRADELVSLDEKSVVTLEQESPTWTRHS